MKIIFLIAFLILGSNFLQAQNEKIASIDFVSILNDNRDEAVFYYENNWKVLREMALEKGYIDSFQFLEEASGDPQDSTDIILITTYKDSLQFEKREEHFQELIKIKGPLSLLNEKKPGGFRKTIKSQDFLYR